MRTPLLLVSVGLVAAPGWSQSFYVPARSAEDQLEANDRTNYPLMRAQSRSQYLIAPSELGPPATLTRMSLRYNGPSYGTGGGTLARLDVYLSNNGVAPGASSGSFDANYTGALTKVFSAQNLAFGADTSTNPAPWGGPSGELTFVFASPFNYTGGNLVLEIRADGNTNAGATPFNCLLDAEIDGRAGSSGGSSVPHGTGCHGAQMAVGGQLAPGGQLALSGSGLGAGSPVFAALGTSRTQWAALTLPFSLGVFGAVNCFVYNDWSLSVPMVADASGNIAAYSAGTVLSLPNVPQVAGAVLQAQYFAIRPGINPFHAVTSNNVEVTIGSTTASARGYFAHWNHVDRNAAAASYSTPAILAMRFN